VMIEAAIILLAIGGISVTFPFSMAWFTVIDQRIRRPRLHPQRLRIRKRLVFDLIDDETGRLLLEGEDEDVVRDARDEIVGRNGGG
jgi:hypothetical protein